MGVGFVVPPMIVCSCCAAVYSPARWQRLELVGIQRDGVVCPLILRNCTCGSTIAVEQWRSRGDRWLRVSQRLDAARDRLKETAGTSAAVAAHAFVCGWERAG